MTFLEKLQNLPQGRRKLILWIAVILLSIFLLFWQIPVFKKIFNNSGKVNILEEFKIPNLREKTKNTFKAMGPKNGEIKKAENQLKVLLNQTGQKKSEGKTPKNKK